MLTRLEVDGFKNLRSVDVYLGPFTCIAGPNGVGKSNLFDVIAFLSALAQMPLMDAALSVRGAAARHGDVRNLFHRRGEHTSSTITFAAEMIVPREGEDALGQSAQASMTFLRYELGLRYREDPAVRSMGTLEIVRESMTHINKGDAKTRLPFPHDQKWRDSVVTGRRTSPYISTDTSSGQPLVALHADSAGGLGGGRPNKVPAAGLPRTMLSTVTNAAEHRTLVLARQEMASWTQLHLEPTALRAPDSFTAPRSIAHNGAHLPSALYHLAGGADTERTGGATDLYARVANRLSDLVENVRNIEVEVDERRQLFTVLVTDRHGTSHVASALSDGTLRFLALTVMEADPRGQPVLCLEEPENGIHPGRIPAVIKLLGDIAVDPFDAVDADNPLRQVIVNTHSPSVVACVEDGSLLVAQEVSLGTPDGTDTFLNLGHLPRTWRSRAAPQGPTVGVGELMSYLNPLGHVDLDPKRPHANVGSARRVLDREDLQLILFPDKTGT